MISLVIPCLMWLSPLPSASSVVPDCPCVDEARRHDSAGRVDRLPGTPRGEVADRRDTIAPDADVGAARFLARAVEHLAAADDEVELGGSARAERRSEAGEREKQSKPDHRRHYNSAV